MVPKFPNNKTLASSDTAHRRTNSDTDKTEDITLAILVGLLEEVRDEMRTTREEVTTLTKTVTTGFDDVFEQLGDLLNSKYTAYKKLEKLKEAAREIEASRKSAAS